VLEDPNTVRVIGTELRLQVDLGPASAADMTGATALTGDASITNAGGRLRLRGIIDRLELDQDGELVVTDYKTGRPRARARSRPGWGGPLFMPSCANNCWADARPGCSCST